ncbi:hypothetical protein D2E26_1277 [Bifidobacterium dolichotidis]|uniref:Uncharacterized protein n=1 Tax=Bifidobacterium dolichotidis TaxID=2306976 RepID=A0A430FQV7_9BIFI|nr:hypothetical protein [Bifidobacterium dolichotidis]RSX55223.1 hypothetical protein D2E26_1277 [Bifidobacterium dolichotidis]
MNDVLIKALETFINEDYDEAWKLYDQAAQGNDAEGNAAADIDTDHAAAMRSIVAYAMGKQALEDAPVQLLEIAEAEAQRIIDAQGSLDATAAVKACATSMFMTLKVLVDWLKAQYPDNEVVLPHELSVEIVHVLRSFANMMDRLSDTYSGISVVQPFALMMPNFYMLLEAVASSETQAVLDGKATFEGEEITELNELLNAIDNEQDGPSEFLKITLNKVMAEDRKQRFTAQDFAAVTKKANLDGKQGAAQQGDAANAEPSEADAVAAAIEAHDMTADKAFEQATADTLRALRKFTRQPLAHLTEFHNLAFAFAYVADMATDPTLRQTDERDQKLAELYRRLYDFVDTARDVILMRQCPGGKADPDSVEQLKNNLVMLSMTSICATATGAELVDLVPEMERTFNRLVTVSLNLMKRVVAPERLTDGKEYHGFEDTAQNIAVLSLRFILVLAASGLR